MKTYTLEPTKNPDLFRVVDTEGNWSHYFLKSKNLYLRGVTSILDRGYAKGFGFNQWLLSKTKEEAEQILTTTGEKGDRVHRWIDLVLSAEPGKSSYARALGVYDKTTDDHDALNLDEWSCALSFASFWQKHEPIVYVSEAPLYNCEVGYAGTSDGIIVLTKACGIRTCPCKDIIGKLGLWDWKTGSGIRQSYFAQTASYAKAENIPAFIPADKKIEYIAVLRLGTTHTSTGGYEMKWKADVDGCFNEFLAAKTIDDSTYKPFDPAVDIQEIPDSVEIHLTKFVEQKKEVSVKKPKAKKPRKPRAKKNPKQLTINPDAKS